MAQCKVLGNCEYKTLKNKCRLGKCIKNSKERQQCLEQVN
jgi:hypothetical protein